MGIFPVQTYGMFPPAAGTRYEIGVRILDGVVVISWYTANIPVLGSSDVGVMMGVSGDMASDVCVGTIAGRLRAALLSWLSLAIWAERRRSQACSASFRLDRSLYLSLRDESVRSRGAKIWYIPHFM